MAYGAFIPDFHPEAGGATAGDNVPLELVAVDSLEAARHCPAWVFNNFWAVLRMWFETVHPG